MNLKQYLPAPNQINAPKAYEILKAWSRLDAGDEAGVLLSAMVAELGLFHHILYKHKSYFVRAAVARAGGYHEVLHKDQNIVVVKCVAEAGGYHEVFHTDQSPDVRAAVAKAGGYHEVLHKDKSEDVRAAVAGAGGYHEVLYKDKSEDVRAAVAGAGGYLQELLDKVHERNLAIGMKKVYGKLFDSIMDEIHEYSRQTLKPLLQQDFLRTMWA